MTTPPTNGRIYKPLDVESNILITVNNIGIRMKADGKYVIFSGSILRAFLSVRKNSGIISAVSKMIDSADSILSNVDVNICLYNERFVVMGPKAMLVVNWAKSAIFRFLNSSHK